MTTSSSASRKDSLFTRWLKPSALLAERDRLEAFLAAFPGEYCGFNPDGSLAYSKGFLELLNLRKITGITDIQHALRPGDAAALENCYIHLKEQRQKFVLKKSARVLSGSSYSFFDIITRKNPPIGR